MFAEGLNQVFPDVGSGVKFFGGFSHLYRVTWCRSTIELKHFH